MRVLLLSECYVESPHIATQPFQFSEQAQGLEFGPNRRDQCWFSVQRGSMAQQVPKPYLYSGNNGYSNGKQNGR